MSPTFFSSCTNSQIKMQPNEPPSSSALPWMRMCLLCLIWATVETWWCNMANVLILFLDVSRCFPAQTRLIRTAEWPIHLNRPQGNIYQHAGLRNPPLRWQKHTDSEVHVVTHGWKTQLRTLYCIYPTSSLFLLHTAPLLLNLVCHKSQFLGLSTAYSCTFFICCIYLFLDLFLWQIQPASSPWMITIDFTSSLVLVMMSVGECLCCSCVARV